MVKYGLEPDWPAEAQAELKRLSAVGGRVERATCATCRGRRSTTTSRATWISSRSVSKDPSPRLLIAIADVDALVHRGSALDAHARSNTTSVYTPARIFPMLPPELSTDRTSLNEHADRDAHRRRHDDRDRRRGRPVRRVSGARAQSREADLRRRGGLARRDAGRRQRPSRRRRSCRRRCSSRIGWRQRCARGGRSRARSISIGPR